MRDQTFQGFSVRIRGLGFRACRRVSVRTLEVGVVGFSELVVTRFVIAGTYARSVKKVLRSNDTPFIAVLESPSRSVHQSNKFQGSTTQKTHPQP